MQIERRKNICNRNPQSQLDGIYRDAYIAY
jgi:hypothetical protein